MILALAFLGLLVGCEPDPAGPEMEAAVVAPAPAFFAPMQGSMDSNKGAVIHKGEIGCGVVDGEGHWFPPEPDLYTLPCNIEVATNSKNLNAVIVVKASGVPNPTGETVHWGPYNPGTDWEASYPDLIGPPYPCFLLGTDYDLNNPLFTVNWKAWVTPSGEAKLVCHYQKKWEFQWPD
jgi:hypothetical protein